MKLNPSFNATAIIVLSTIFFFTIGPTPSIAEDKLCLQNYRSCKYYAKARYLDYKSYCKSHSKVSGVGGCLGAAADEYSWNLVDCKLIRYDCNMESPKKLKRKHRKKIK